MITYNNFPVFSFLPPLHRPAILTSRHVGSESIISRSITDKRENAFIKIVSPPLLCTAGNIIDHVLLHRAVCLHFVSACHKNPELSLCKRGQTCATQPQSVCVGWQEVFYLARSCLIFCVLFLSQDIIIWSYIGHLESLTVFG